MKERIYTDRGIQIKEILTPDYGIFFNMNHDFPNIDKQQMDTIFLANYGERLISPLVAGMLNTDYELPAGNLPLLAELVESYHIAQWERVERALSAQYDVLNGYNRQTTNKLTIDTKLTDSGTVNDSETAKIYGLGSTSGADNNSRDSEQTRDITHANNGEELREISETGYNNPQNLISGELKIALWNYIQSVITTVSNDLTLNIY